ncbi:MAG: universal stress protein [Aggregatilineales bacterium]
MLEHILITLDGSELAELALPYAKQLVKPGGRITLLTVLDIQPERIYPMYDMAVSLPIYSEDNMRETEDAGRAYLKRIAEQVRGMTDDVQVNIVCIIGEAATVIVDQAGMLDVDAVLMSTHGRSGLNRWIFGSVTQKVLTMLPCPVFVIPGRQAQKEETPDMQPGNLATAGT